MTIVSSFSNYNSPNLKRRKANLIELAKPTQPSEYDFTPNPYLACTYETKAKANQKNNEPQISDD